AGHVAGGACGQGEKGLFVLRGAVERPRARHELPRSLCPEEHEREAVVDQRKAIFNGDAGHGAPCAVSKPGGADRPHRSMDSYGLKSGKSSFRAPSRSWDPRLISRTGPLEPVLFTFPQRSDFSASPPWYMPCERVLVEP